MKITFIQPYYHNVWEALGIGYLISYLKANYKEPLDINFFQGYFDSDSSIVSGADDSAFVFFSCTSPAYQGGLRLAREIKRRNPGCRIVFGGWHPTALPEDVIQEDCVDQVVVGEGEGSVLRVVRGLKDEIVREVGKLHPDEIPWPDRDAIKNLRTITKCEDINGKRTASFQLNRGCKAHCKYCAEIGMTGKHNSSHNPIRTRKSCDVLREIEKVESDYNIDYFKFVDATFDKDPKTVIDFCNAKIDCDNTLEWECNIHPGFVQREDVFEALSEANCKQINVGCESGSPKILKQIGKGTRVKHIENVFRWAKKYGIETRAFFIIGMPDEDVEDLILTKKLIDRIRPDYSGFTLLCPYPGTDFYNPEEHRDIDWSFTDEYSNGFWRNKHHNNAKLKHIQEHFIDVYRERLCERQRKI